LEELRQKIEKDKEEFDKEKENRVKKQKFFKEQIDGQIKEKIEQNEKRD
jgi:hypothetical protein